MCNRKATVEKKKLTSGEGSVTVRFSDNDAPGFLCAELLPCAVFHDMYGFAEKDRSLYGKPETPQSIQPHSDLNCYLLLLLLSLSLILVIKIISLQLKMFSWFWRFYFKGTVSVPLDVLFYCISMYLVAFLCFFEAVCAIETECSLFYTTVQCHYQQLICWHIMSPPISMWQKVYSQ